MFFVYGTDAPVYYWPFTTVALIVVNAVVFCALLANPELAKSLVLTHGDGLHPAQWVTSNFVHGGIMHLAGNMLCLWSFGLIVEGKLGWYRMLAVYLAIGVLQCAVEQFLMVGATGGGSYGASAIVFGLMAMSLVWAPENQMQCMFVYCMRPIEFEMKVASLVGLMLLLELAIAVLTQMALSSAVLHLMGAVAGFAVAIPLLKSGQVDCEHWDIFSVWTGRNRLSPEERAKAEAEAEAETQRQRELAIQQAKQESAREQIRQILADDKPEFAAKAHQQMQRKMRDWTLPEADLLAIIQGLHKKSLWSESVPLMDEYVTRHPENGTLMRLQLAQILAIQEKRPAQALKVISRIDPATLDPRHREFLGKLRAKAVQMHKQSANEAADHER